MPPTLSKLIDVRLKKDGVELPGVYSVRLTFRDKLYVRDQCTYSEHGPFERCYAICERTLRKASDVPGVEWGSDMDDNLAALGEDRVVSLAMHIIEAAKLTEDDRKN